MHSHYTGHFKSVITKPQNVFVMRDLMVNGYRAGGNAKFFGLNKDGVFSLSEAREQIGARLNFEADAGDDPIYASMLAFPMTTKQSEKIHNEITVTSRLLPWETHSPNDREGFPGGAAMYTFYKSRLGLDQVKIHTVLTQNGNHAQTFPKQETSHPHPRRRCITAKICAHRKTWSTCRRCACARYWNTPMDCLWLPTDQPIPSRVSTGLDEQLALLHWPAPLVRLGHRRLHGLPRWRWYERLRALES